MITLKATVVKIKNVILLLLGRFALSREYLSQES